MTEHRVAPIATALLMGLLLGIGASASDSSENKLGSTVKETLTDQNIGTTSDTASAPSGGVEEPDEYSVAKIEFLGTRVQSDFLGDEIPIGNVISGWDYMDVDWVVPFQSTSDSPNPFRFVQETRPVQPFDPTAGLAEFAPRQPFDPLAPAGMYAALAAVSTAPSIPEAPTSSTITAADVAITAAPDLGAVLQASNTVLSIGSQQRSPVAFDPHIRGYKLGQIYAVADGAFWWPVRLDLDTMLSKIDPWMVRDVTIIEGPYGLRYGPGLAFVDITTYDTPRYCGYESHARVGYSIQTNGGRNYGRTAAYGGNSDWGYIVSYGVRAAADYHPGDSAPLPRIPSGYHMQNFSGQFGFDLGDDARIEFRYNRLDATDTEIAAQIFDIDYQVTDAFAVTYIKPDPCYGGDLRLTGWYNRSRFAGSFPPPTVLSGKRLPPFSVVDRIENALGFGLVGNTDGDLSSSGGRLWRTFGEPDGNLVRIGADINVVEQQLLEQYSQAPGSVPNPNFPFFTNLPRSQMIDPGAFAEWTYNWTPWLSTSIGGRVDGVWTDAQYYDQRFFDATGNPSFIGFPDGVRSNSSLAGVPDSLPQDDILYAFYGTSDLFLTDGLNLRVGFGHAQRAPTLTERYADGVFLGIIQSGFSRVIGTPNLDKERGWQLDVSLTADYEQWRGSVRGYYGWILDYITFQANPIADPTGARLLVTTNTHLATLAGVEMNGEYDLREWLSVFATASYIEGRDREINAALPQIVPLQGRAGLRVHQVADQPAWGLELAAWMSNQQNRIGYLRPTFGNGLIPVELPTPGFTVFNLRGYWQVSDRLNLVGGVDNLFDRTYLTHLDLRLPDQGQFRNTVVYSPGITPYAGIEWNY